ncbi:MAG: choice-of-anchor Q domain-containing protein [Pseudomonadota bacterium]
MNRSALSVAIVTLLYSSSNFGATIVVSTPLDSESDDGQCSLREAIASANLDPTVKGDLPAGECAAGDADRDLIIFDDLVFSLVTEIQLLQGQLMITDDLQIDGTVGGNDIRIIGTGNDRVFAIDTVDGPGVVQNVQLSNLLLENGTSTSGGIIHNAAGSDLSLFGVTVSGGAATGNEATEGGGGIYNAGDLTISDSTISENSATGDAGSGGGILNIQGTVTITGGELSGNTASRAGGGIETYLGVISLDNVSLENNATGSTPGNGGGLHVTGAGDVTIEDSDIAGNTAAAEGGGLWNGGGTMMILDGTQITGNTASGDSADQGGGGVFNNGGTLLIDSVTISGNTADGAAGSGGGILSDGGSLAVTGGTITGNTANRAGGGIEITDVNFPGASGTLTDVTVSENLTGTAPGNGGGLHLTGMANVEVTGGGFTGNTAGAEGGGLWNGSGLMTIDGTTISGNTASGDSADQGGGGIFNNGGSLEVSSATIQSNTADGFAGSGGGILVDGGTLDITGGTIAGNFSNRAGGGIEVTDANFGTGGATLVNVLVTENETGAAPGNGGGLHLTGMASADVTDGTFSGNTAGAEGGGLWNSAGLMSINGTQISGNIASGAGADQGGGGIFNNGGTVTISGATIADNVADGFAGSGGGVLGDGGLVTITDTTISGNTAQRAGGGIEATSANFDAALVALAGVTINNNTTGPVPGNGGGLHLTGVADATVSGGLFSGNSAAAEGGGLWNSSGTMTIDGAVISSNGASGDEADQGGGGIFNNGGTLMILGTEEPTFIGGNFANGELGSGGGILSDGGSVTIMNSRIDLNASHRAGGGIEIDATGEGGASLLIEDTAIIRNLTGPQGFDTPGNGGGVHVTGPGIVDIVGGNVANNSAAAEGGGLWNGSGPMTISGLDISGNTASGDESSEGGGGIFNAGGTVLIDDVTVQNNFANGSSGSGGGILNDAGVLRISDTTIGGNDAQRAGGGIETLYGSAYLDSVTVTGNTTGPAPGNGGGLHITGEGIVEVTGGQFLNNTASEEGGGLWNSPPGQMTITDVTISGNTANGTAEHQGGGGIFNLGVATVEGSIIDGNVATGDGPGEGGGGIFNDGDLTIRNSDFTGNEANTGAGNGGGILNTDAGIVRLTGGMISSNTAARAGGGIENIGTLQVVDLSAMGNFAGINGGMLHISDSGQATFSGSTITMNGAANEGGGLWVSERGSLSLTDTTVDDNDAVFGGGIFVDAGEGGGQSLEKLVVTRGAITRNAANASGGGVSIEDGRARIENSTVSGNVSADGGGIFLFEPVQLTIDYATIAGNTAESIGGGVNNETGGGFEATNSLFGDNSAPSAPDVAGVVIDGGFNVIEDPTGAELTRNKGESGTQLNVDPLIGELADNGGGTETHALLNGSPAIDAADPANCIQLDQRGFGRTDGACDIGAFEKDAVRLELVFRNGFEN